MPPKLNGKEIYAAVLLLLISTLLLTAQVIESFSSYSDAAIRSEKSSLIVNTKSILNTIYSYALAILGLLGGIFMFRIKRIGWIFTTSLFVFYLVLAVYGLNEIGWDEYDLGFIIVAVPTLLFLMAAVFLFFRSTLQKFRVGKKTILPTLLLFMALITLFFLK